MGAVPVALASIAITTDVREASATMAGKCTGLSLEQKSKKKGGGTVVCQWTLCDLDGDGFIDWEKFHGCVLMPE